MMSKKSKDMLKQLVELRYENLLNLLNAHNVEFVVIGATAFPVHEYARATLDRDLFIRPELEKPSTFGADRPQNHMAIHPRSGERGILAFSREAVRFRVH